MGTTKKFTKCSKHCALDTSPQDFQIAAIINLVAHLVCIMHAHKSC